MTMESFALRMKQYHVNESGCINCNYVKGINAVLGSMFKFLLPLSLWNPKI